MYEGVCRYTGWSRTDLGPQTAFRRTFKKKKKLTVRRHYLIVYSCCEAYWASKAPVKVVLYSRDGASLLRPQQVCDAASAWQSVWIVLNVDINQATVLDSCHPGSPQLWCQIPFSDHRRRGILCAGSANPRASRGSRLMFWQMPLSKNIIMQAASVN